MSKDVLQFQPLSHLLDAHTTPNVSLVQIHEQCDSSQPLPLRERHHLEMDTTYLFQEQASKFILAVG